MSTVDEIAVYKAYIEAKSDKKKTVTSVATDFGITRNGLYEIVRRIESGNTHKIRTCTEKSRLDCLWQYKYKARFMAIPNNRKEGSIELLTKLVREMNKDKFPTSQIATLIGKDRSTVLHHLEK